MSRNRICARKDVSFILWTFLSLNLLHFSSQKKRSSNGSFDRRGSGVSWSSDIVSEQNTSHASGNENTEDGLYAVEGARGELRGTYCFQYNATSISRHLRDITNVPLKTGFVQNLKVLECPWIWKQKFKALNVLEFVKKYLNVLEFILLQFLDIFWNCLTFKTDILLNWFCMFISDLFIKLRFEQFNVRFCWFLTPSLQYLVLEFADTWPWKVLEFDSSWHVRTLLKGVST
jgi:hypothetical protein